MYQQTFRIKKIMENKLKYIEIPYKIKLKQCITLCPYILGNPPSVGRIGSYFCDKCKYNKGYNIEDSTVKCSYMIDHEHKIIYI